MRNGEILPSEDQSKKGMVERLGEGGGRNYKLEWGGVGGKMNEK